MREMEDLRNGLLAGTVVWGNQVEFVHLRAAFRDQKYTPITIWPALRFPRDQINSLRNGRDSDLEQIENAFKDPEEGFWEKNSSEGIVEYTRSILEIRGQ